MVEPLRVFELPLRTRHGQGAARFGVPTQPLAPYAGSRFKDVWDAVCSDPYERLPEHVVTLREVLHWRTLWDIYLASRRTLNDPHDLLPAFDKPVHPVGICLRGTWEVTEPNPYTGYFRAGSKGLLIARASDNMGEHRAGRLRFLALAGKLYPTTDPEHATRLPTANFVMNESLAGTHTRHYLDATLATDLLPKTSPLDLDHKLIGGTLVAVVFALADRAKHLTQGLFRQLYPVAELGEADLSKVHAPAVMRLVSDPDNRRIDTSELREELQMENHPDGIRYAIEVADHRALRVPQNYLRIGTVHFTQSVASYSGDHRLHFHHPRFRQGKRRDPPPTR